MRNGRRTQHPLPPSLRGEGRGSVGNAEQPDPRFTEFIERLAEALATEHLREQAQPQPEEKNE